MQAKRIIEEEHRSLAAVLHGMLYVVREIRYMGMQPDFVLLEAMAQGAPIVSTAEDGGGEHEAQHRLGHPVAFLERGGGEAHLVAHHAVAAADQRLLELSLQRVGLLEGQVRRELTDRAHRDPALPCFQEMLEERGGHVSAAGRGSSRAVTVARTAAALPRITRSA